MCAVHRAIYVHHPSSLSTYEFEIFKSRWHTSSSLLWRHGRTNYLSIDFPICVDQNARPTRRALRSHTHRHICSWVCLQNKSIRTETTPQNNNNKQKNNGLMCNPRMALMLVPAHLMYIKWTHSDVMAYTQAFIHALHCVRRTVHLCYDNLSVAHSLIHSHTLAKQTNDWRLRGPLHHRWKCVWNTQPQRSHKPSTTTQSHLSTYNRRWEKNI